MDGYVRRNGVIVCNGVTHAGCFGVSQIDYSGCLVHM